MKAATYQVLPCLPTSAVLGGEEVLGCTVLGIGTLALPWNKYVASLTGLLLLLFVLPFSVCVYVCVFVCVWVCVCVGNLNSYYLD